MDRPGVCSLFHEGKEVARGGQFDFVDIKRIGDCADCPEGTSPFSIVVGTNLYSTNWTLSHQNRLNDSSLGGELIPDVSRAYPFSTVIIEECIPSDCWYLSIFPRSIGTDIPCWPTLIGSGSLFYNATYDGVLVAEHGGDINCLSNIDFGVCSPTQTIEGEEGSVRVQIEITFAEPVRVQENCRVDQIVSNLTIIQAE